MRTCSTLARELTLTGNGNLLLIERENRLFSSSSTLSRCFIGLSFFLFFFFSLPLPKIFLNSRKNRYVPLNCVHQCRAWPGRVGQCVTVVWHIPGVIRTHVCVCICVCVRACASVCSPCEFLETGVRLHLSVATFISMDLHKT